VMSLETARNNHRTVKKRRDVMDVMGNSRRGSPMNHYIILIIPTGSRINQLIRRRRRD
jgi:hypothetical protein